MGQILSADPNFPYPLEDDHSPPSVWASISRACLSLPVALSVAEMTLKAYCHLESQSTTKDSRATKSKTNQSKKLSQH